MNGHERRDTGAAAALQSAGSEWSQRARGLVLEYLAMVGAQGALMEWCRMYAVSKGLGKPPSPNAWGAVALVLARRQRIERTGQMYRSVSPRSHARLQPLWRLTPQAQRAMETQQ